MTDNLNATKVKWASWYGLALLAVIYSVNYIDRFSITVTQELVKREFHMNDGQIGLISGLIYGVPYALAGIPIGMLVDRVNRKRLLAVLMSVWGVFTALSGFSTSYLTLAGARAMVAAAEAGASPTCMSMIGDMFPPARRSMAASIFLLSTSIGSGVVFVVGALVASAWGWRSVFFLAGAPCIVLVLVLAFTFRDPTREADATNHQEKAPNLRETASFARSQHAFIHIIAALTTSSIALSGMAGWAISYFVRVQGMTINKAGLIVGLGVGIAGAAGLVFSGLTTDRLAKRDIRWLAWWPAMSTILLTLVGLSVVFAQGRALAAPLFMAYVFVSVCHWGAGYGAAISLMKPRMRGLSTSALQIIVNLLGASVGPVLVGVFSDAFAGPNSLRFALAIVLCAGLWSSSHFLMASRTLKADMARATS